MAAQPWEIWTKPASLDQEDARNRVSTIVNDGWVKKCDISSCAQSLICMY